MYTKGSHHTSQPRWCILGLIQSRLEVMEKLCLPLSHPKTHSTLQSTSSLTRTPEETEQIPPLLFSTTSSWVKVAGHHLQGIWWPSLVYLKAPCSSEQTQPELCGCVSIADMCSMICCNWTHHWARWCVLRLHPIPSPLEGPAPGYYPKTPLRSLIHRQEVGTCGVAPVGRQSWDQTKHCIKSCRYNCLCTNSHANNSYLQGVTVVTEQHATKRAVTNWICSMKKMPKNQEKQAKV